MSDLLRHIRACNNAVLPGDRLPLLLEGESVGWIGPALAPRLQGLGAATTPHGIALRADQLEPLSRALADAGAFRWRGEAFDVRASAGGAVLGQLDRGALPAFGVQAVGVHLNGLVERDGETWLWVGRRSADRLLDPGKLDHLTAGGVPAGHTPASTLEKEAGEEAGLPPEMVRQAQPVGLVGYAMERQEGLRRDLLHCFDLLLPPTFTPEPRDDEVEAFELWELGRVLDTVRRTDRFKFNVNLVLIDLFLRRGLVQGDEAAVLRAALSAGGRAP